jgi:ribosomal protein S18 acetylase RimI-like enzyme
MDDLHLNFEPLIDGAMSQFITDGVNSHNVAMTGQATWYPVNYVLRSPAGEIAGGLLGHVWGGWLEVKILWVAEAHRGRGQASRLLAAAEDYARGRGARNATLDTHNAQARALYERLGYEEIGRLEDYPPGHAKVILRKALA